jgi:hypothetical protein
MSDLRKAAEMALEFVAWFASDDHSIRPKHKAPEIAEALRQALAQTEKPPVKTYCGGKPNYCTPHVDAVNMSQERVNKTEKREHEPVAYVPGFYCEEKISLSRIKLGERFVLVRTGQIYFKTKDGYWNESEQRPARLHLNCQVQLIKEKNT